MGSLSEPILKIVSVHRQLLGVAFIFVLEESFFFFTRVHLTYEVAHSQNGSHGFQDT